ncbi:hypothetical protein [Bacillus sp. FJAT-27251]|uniref:hypothetical protein n=1 Tax=Bacillus sp. FJAT-27251 TaxID=1684142 RepID=UPI0006A76921|nr:hypothetical protein [Bacillus sp. FJAT-27251]
MKRFKLGSAILLFIILVLAGCGDDSHIKQFYSSGEGKYKIFIVGVEEFDDSELVEDGSVNNIESVYIASSMEAAEEEFAYLDIKESPAFIVFDHKEIIYKTNNQDDLIAFLKKKLK